MHGKLLSARPEVAHVALAHVALGRTRPVATPPSHAEYLCAWEEVGGHSCGEQALAVSAISLL